MDRQEGHGIMIVLEIVGAAVIALAALVVVVELGLRFYTWFDRRFLVEEVRRKDFLDPAYHPYVEWIEDWSKPMFAYIPIGFRIQNTEHTIPQVRLNRLGFRTSEFEPPEPDELRVVLLGGSAAWGFGASSNEQTIAGHLEHLLNSDGALLGDRRRGRVLNLAQVNQTQTQDILAATFLFPTLRPDIAISLGGWNEFAASIMMPEDVLLDHHVYPITEMLGWVPLQAGAAAERMAKDAFFKAAGRHFESVRWLDRKRATPASPFKRTIEENVPIVTPLVLRNLEIMTALSRAFDFRHFQFFQPNLYRKAHPTDAEAKVLDMYDNYRPKMGGRVNGDYLRNHNPHTPVTSAAADEERYGPVTDLYDLFRTTTERRFYSLVHCTDQGYREIAESIYATLRAKIGRDGPRRSEGL